eukprot:TRINITY_DN5975_c0_g3_i2.p1 TRINITY_DN5975_c0_g3~~TRINITY_DN5975_c0_g3_i2.p1  ORF type:complete len:737 (-),score=268.30 TRINITY_DN5975_c0_g3_i2:1569-3779(-)
MDILESTSVLASKRKHALNLEDKYTKLLKNNEKNTTQLESSLRETRGLRQQSEQQKKEIINSQRAIEHLKQENKQLKAHAKSNRDYAMKIEQKLAVGAKGQYLVERNDKLRDQVNKLRNDLDTKQRMLNSQEAELDKAAKEIEILARALEIRAHDIGLEGNVRSGLLYQIANLKEDTHRLQIEIVEKNDKIHHDRENITTLTSDNQEKHEELTILRTRAGELSELLQQRTESEAKIEKELFDFKTERQVMLDYIKELAEKNNVNEDELDELKKERDTLEDTLSEVRINLSAEVDDLRRKFEETDSRLKRSQDMQNLTEESLVASRRENASMREELDSLTENYNQTKNENSDLHAQIDRLTELSNELQNKVYTLQTERSRSSTELDELKDTKLSLERDIENQDKQHDSVVTALRAEMDRTLEQLKASMRSKETLRSSYEDAENRNGKMAKENERLRVQLDACRKQLQSTREGKAVLQRTMLAQITSARENADDERKVRQELDEVRSRQEILRRADHIVSSLSPSKSPGHNHEHQEFVATQVPISQRSSSPDPEPRPPLTASMARTTINGNNSSPLRKPHYGGVPQSARSLRYLDQASTYAPSSAYNTNNNGAMNEETIRPSTTSALHSSSTMGASHTPVSAPLETSHLRTESPTRSSLHHTETNNYSPKDLPYQNTNDLNCSPKDDVLMVTPLKTRDEINSLLNIAQAAAAGNGTRSGNLLSPSSVAGPTLEDIANF